MARTAYYAPGVYVEEVPSTQKPIAGVGTNTAAFIGIVPDIIEIPVPNENYDPTEAAKAAGEAGPDQQKIKELQDKIDQHEIGRKKAEQDLSEAESELKKKDLSEPDKKKFLKQRDNSKDKMDFLDNEISAAKQQMAALKKPASTDKDKIRPYKLEEFKPTAEAGDPKLCTNFSEYRDRFGDFSADDENSPGKAKYPGHRALTHAVFGFFQNGGTRCFVARIKNAAELPRTLEHFESIDAVALVAAPGMSDDSVYSALVSHCEICEDRFAILDCPEVVGGDDVPNLQLLNYDDPVKSILPKTNKNAAYYFPWIRVMDPAVQLQDQDPSRNVELKRRGNVYVAPSGHIAGIYAHTDEERGVHKAPANASVLGALDVRYYIGKPKHELLNPQGVNVIRNMNGSITVWGARTIGGDKNAEWKYVSVRRLFLYLRESIDEGTQWVVFEPNDMALWGKIRRNVGAFLTNVWRSGALFGSTPEEAFYVKCDAETNPPEVREVGQVVTEIGVAIVRPAEFVIFRIMQSGALQRS